MTDRWRGNSDVFVMDAPRWPPKPAAAPPEPDEPRLSQREKWKRKLERAYLDPHAPKYWNDPPIDPVTTITTPAVVNPREGAGLTLEEIEQRRVAQQTEFARQLAERWLWNVAHL